jgi:hypothetical protein
VIYNCKKIPFQRYLLHVHDIVEYVLNVVEHGVYKYLFLNVKENEISVYLNCEKVYIFLSVYLHSSLLKIWNFFQSWEKFSVFPLVPIRSTREKTEFLTLVEEIPYIHSQVNVMFTTQNITTPRAMQ